MACCVLTEEETEHFHKSSKRKINKQPWQQTWTNTICENRSSWCASHLSVETPADYNCTLNENRSVAAERRRSSLKSDQSQPGLLASYFCYFSVPEGPTPQNGSADRELVQKLWYSCLPPLLCFWCSLVKDKKKMGGRIKSVRIFVDKHWKKHSEGLYTLGVFLWQQFTVLSVCFVLNPPEVNATYYTGREFQWSEEAAVLLPPQKNALLQRIKITLAARWNHIKTPSWLVADLLNLFPPSVGQLVERVDRGVIPIVLADILIDNKIPLGRIWATGLWCWTHPSPLFFFSYQDMMTWLHCFLVNSIISPLVQNIERLFSPSVF